MQYMSYSAINASLDSIIEQAGQMVYKTINEAQCSQDSKQGVIDIRVF